MVTAWLLFASNRLLMLFLYCLFSWADAELDDDWAAQRQQDAEDAYFADA